MGDKINEDFVGIHLESGGSWVFTIADKIGYISEANILLEEIICKLFNACETFIHPTEVECSIRLYSKDISIKSIDPSITNPKTELKSVDDTSITNENGLTVNDIPFRSSIQQSEYNDVQIIANLKFNGIKSRIKLSDNDGWIDSKNNHLVKPARFDEIYDGQADYDPIEIQIRHIPSSAVDSNANIGFGIHLISRTDIWFEETPIGQANRHRFEAFIKRLFEEFDIIDTEVVSRHPEWMLQKFLPADI
jgi:hypothetical protein